MSDGRNEPRGRVFLRAMAKRDGHRRVKASALAGVAASLAALVAVLAGAAGPLAAGAVEHGRATQSATRPNVLLIETDDQTLDDMRVLPNVRRLVGDQGVTFDQSFVSYSLCCPSRATVLTGQYAHHHGVQGNQAPEGGYYKLASANTLAVWLQHAGYATVHLGKYLNQYGTRAPRNAVPPGWTEWHGLMDPTTYQYYNYTLNDNGVLHAHSGGAAADYQTDVLAGMAREIILRRAASTQPFFLWTAFLAPHSGGPKEAGDPARLATPAPAPRHQHAFDSEPLPQPPSFNEADVSDKPVGIRNRPVMAPARINAVTESYRQRHEALLAVDEAVAGIFQALAQTGELDSTLVLFTSDNGFFHGEHRVPNGKVLLYEPSIRVPLMMRGPGVPAGVHRSQLVANIDIAPTIVDVAGAHATRSMDGTSLLPLARDGGLQLGRDLLLENGPLSKGPNVYRAIRTKRYLYARYANGEREFYDLVRDPFELHSAVTAANRRVRSSLGHRLDRLAACRGTLCRTHPRLKLVLSYRRGRDAGGASCVRGNVRAEVRGDDRRSVKKVGFYVGGARVVTDGHGPFAKRLSLSRFAAGALTQVRARVTSTSDRLLTLDRKVRRCA